MLDTSMTECIAPNTTTTDSTTMDTSTPTSPHDQVEDEEDNGLMMALDSPDVGTMDMVDRVFCFLTISFDVDT